MYEVGIVFKSNLENTKINNKNNKNNKNTVTILYYLFVFRTI